jgi:hypothetical protein
MNSFPAECEVPSALTKGSGDVRPEPKESCSKNGSAEHRRLRKRAESRRYWEKNKELLRAKARGRYHRLKNLGLVRKKERPETAQARSRAFNLSRRYGVTLDEYNKLFSAQGGMCALCKRHPGKRRLSVDHCHTSGKVRGLLCDACNRGLGLLQDSPALLCAAIQYLSR